MPQRRKELLPLTGYIRDGVIALTARKGYHAFVDEMVELFDVISVSAGVRGTQIRIAPAACVRATDAVQGPISRDKS